MKLQDPQNVEDLLPKFMKVIASFMKLSWRTPEQSSGKLLADFWANLWRIWTILRSPQKNSWEGFFRKNLEMYLIYNLMISWRLCWNSWMTSKRSPIVFSEEVYLKFPRISWWGFSEDIRGKLVWENLKEILEDLLRKRIFFEDYWCMMYEVNLLKNYLHNSFGRSVLPQSVDLFREAQVLSRCEFFFR